jgi:transcriptional regulator of acetoin/glycerol metabolism
MLPLAHSIFHGSPAARVALARERFFEEGQRPTGLIGEAVIQSWDRCLRGRRDTRERVEFDPVTHSRVHHALQLNRDLLAAWASELPALERALASTHCSAILTDSCGVVIAATTSSGSHERLIPVAHRVGVNLSEAAVGTTAPGVAVKTGRAATVLAAEHYFDDLQGMHCAAAPIRDATGRLTGVLDISSEIVPFAFDAAAVVGLVAGAVESRLLIAQAKGLLVLRLQVYPALLDTPMAGLVAVDPLGQVVWANESAAGLLGIVARRNEGNGGSASHAEAVFGIGLGALASVSRSEPRVLALPNGLTIWLRAECDAWSREGGFLAADAAADAAPETTCPGGERAEAGTADAVAEVDASLRGHDRDLIVQVLRDCSGNVSLAAKRLQVSRNLIYRRLRA